MLSLVHSTFKVKQNSRNGNENRTRNDLQYQICDKLKFIIDFIIRSSRIVIERQTRIDTVFYAKPEPLRVDVGLGVSVGVVLWRF